MLIGIEQFCELNNTAILFTEENSAVAEQERKEGEICGELKYCRTLFYGKCVTFKWSIWYLPSGAHRI